MNAFVTLPSTFHSNSHQFKSSFITSRNPSTFILTKSSSKSTNSYNLTRHQIVAKKKSNKNSETENDNSSFTGMAAGPGAPTKRVMRPLGQRNKPRSPPQIEKKTAADFIAEGVEDDIDDLDDFETEDIRFGIDDVKDPFRTDADKQEEERKIEEEKDAQKLVGQQLDVTGDGSVKKIILEKGSGGVIPSGANVTVTYTGYLENGEEFDTSKNRGDGTFTFKLGKGTVIKGWEAAISTMQKDELAKIFIEPNYAYGRRGMPPVIPGNSKLTFEIQVISIQGGESNDIQRVKDFNPDVARTPTEIAQDYDTLLEDREQSKKNRSLFDRFYIISPFASQSGEKPPWWINPNITFFIILISVIIGFYFVVISGAIHIGYVDEPVDVNIFK